MTIAKAILLTSVFVRYRTGWLPKQNWVALKSTSVLLKKLYKC